MEKMSDDILRTVVSFLSTREKIKIREVSKGFINVVTQRTFNEYRLKWLMRNFVLREAKLEEEFYIITRHMYHKRVENRMHPYFSRQCQDKCIVDRCRNERVGHIYIKDSKIEQPEGAHLNRDWWVCSKRKIPYCVHCFEIWMIRCSMEDLNLSSPRAL